MGGSTEPETSRYERTHRFRRILPDDRLGAGKTPRLQKGVLRLSSWPQSHHSIRAIEALGDNEQRSKKILFHTFRNSREKGRQQEKKKKEIRKDNPTWMT